MPTSNGTPVNFGFTGTGGIAITGLAGILLQNADYSAEADKDEVRSGLGDIVNRNWYDQHLKTTLEWVITGTAISNAITNTTIKTLMPPGTILVVTACASEPDLVATNWEVMRSSIKGSNTNAKRVTLEVESRAGITAVSTP